jgi:hypothetical protein
LSDVLRPASVGQDSAISTFLLFHPGRNKYDYLVYEFFTVYA